MRRSDGPSRALDLDRDLPTTPEDVAALRRAKSFSVLSTDGYLAFLAQMPACAAAPAVKPGPRGDRPFELQG